MKNYPEIDGPVLGITDDQLWDVYTLHGGPPEQRGGSERPSVEKYLRQVLDAQSASDAAKAVEWWGNWEDRSAEDYARAVRWCCASNRIWPTDQEYSFAPEDPREQARFALVEAVAITRESVKLVQGGNVKMATLQNLLDGAQALTDYGIDAQAEVRFEHDIAYAGDDNEPSPELVEAMEKAGWQYDELEECFTLGWG